MLRRNPLLTVGLAIVVLIVLDVVFTKFWPPTPLGGLAGDIIVIALVAYIVGAILIRNGVRVRLPALPKRRRMRAVKRDPSKAASDFIRQFEERSKR